MSAIRPNRGPVEAGRYKARKIYGTMPDLCEKCGNVPPVDRHHKDGNTFNNERSNIEFLCRKCHQFEDGRLEFLRTQMPSVGGKAVAALKAAGIITVQRKLSNAQVEEILGSPTHPGMASKLAKKYGVSQGYVRQLMMGTVPRGRKD